MGNRTSVAFSGELKKQVEKEVINIIVNTREKISFSEIIHKCVEDNLESVVQQIIQERNNP